MEKLSPLGEALFGAAFVIAGVVILRYRRRLHALPRAAFRGVLRRARAPLEGSKIDELNFKISYVLMPAAMVVVGLLALLTALLDTLK
jgi:uncharacterized membrane protein